MAADPTLAATALLDRIPSAARALAAAHAEADHWRIGLEWGAVGLTLILFQQGRWLARLSARSGTILGRGALTSLLCALLLTVSVEVAQGPALMLADAIWSRGMFTTDFLTTVRKLPGEALIGALCLWVLLFARRRWPRFGWMGVSAAATVLIFVSVLIPPMTLSPSVRGDIPASGPHTAPILAFVRNGGLDARTLYVFNSADPLAVDMEGVGSLTHAAVSRAALAAPQAETYAAIGHLLGHYRHNDLVWLAALWSAFVAVFCWAAWTACRLLARRADPAVPPALSDARALPVFGLIAWGVLLLATPAFNLFDQIINYHADNYALQLTRNPDALCDWLMTAETGGKPDPSPLEALLFYDHPPLKDRLLNALRWKAAHP